MNNRLLIERSSAKLLTLIYATLLCVSGIFSAAASADDEADVRAVFEKLESTWNAGNMDGYLSAYAATGPMTLTFGNQQVVGLEALTKLFKASYPDPKRMGRFTIDTLSIDFLDANTAVGYGGFTHYFPKETIHGGFSHVLVREDDGWVIRHERTSRASVEHHE
ncbi:MAG: hypothetical protein Cons2KO_11520 [Congregibacter sp.]